MATDKGPDKKDVNQQDKDVGKEVNESMNLASVAGGGGTAPTPSLLANCTSTVMMDQVLELHVTNGNKLLEKYRSGTDNKAELQQHLNSNNEIIPYLNQFSNLRKKALMQVDTEASLPQTGIET